MRFPCGNLGDEETDFRRIAGRGITCCDVVQHRDRHRIAGEIANDPADCPVMFDAIEVDLMPVFGQDRLQQVGVEGDGSSCLGEQERIVRRLPQFVGCRIQDDVGHRVGDQGEWCWVMRVFMRRPWKGRYKGLIR
jgi:hypothetical protein